MTADNSIVFPGLGISVDPSRTAFEIFGFSVYWYGVIIGIGFILGLLYALSRVKWEKIKEDDFLLVLIISLPVSVICARAYYVIFYSSLYFTDGKFDFMRAISIRDGGLAIYGGVIGAFLCAFIICRIKKISFLKVSDCVAVSFLIGQGIGRWGNFFNREAYGEITTLPWRMEIYDIASHARVCVHPTFLYESVWNLAGALILHIYYKKKKFNGEILLLYIAWYGLGRMFIEGLRTDSLYLFDTGIRVSQALAAVSFVCAVVIIIIARIKTKHREIG
ncbi:MAG: prolipoprotein diacylglyceryl transferase [Clostridia bacterium]|nr:prolipoprotein diacylglyceryl transferase [Clostridia bacterium]